MTSESTLRPVMWFHKFFATGAFTGYLPIAPGSWGSLLTCIILWFVWPEFWFEQLPIIVLFYPVAIYFSGKGIRYFGPDGRPIVIDEVIGQMVALFMVPHNIIAYILAFLFFRGFDIIKLPPAKGWEKLPGGTGIVADDIAAGAYAVVLLHLILSLLSKLGVRLI